MAYTHSHRCWVGIAPVRGVETHQRWDAVRQDGRPGRTCAWPRTAPCVRGDVATLTPRPATSTTTAMSLGIGSQPLLAHPPG